MNKCKYFSIIIPTMWMSDKLKTMLPQYESCGFVGEIIIIDNDPTKKYDLSGFSKVRYYTKGTNIFVNPAWNWGVSVAKYKTILANDDIIIENITDILKMIFTSDYDIVGAYLKRDGNRRRIKNISSSTRFPRQSFGCFMYVKNYTIVPENIKIWYGDVLQYHTCKKRGILMNCGIATVASTTINSDKSQFLNVICKNDMKIVSRMIEEGTAVNDNYIY
jgi:hypothetical protein